MDVFGTITRSRLHDAIVEEIVGGIRAGRLAAGDSLPAERLLAEQFGVGRSSVREALRILEHAGVLEVRVGKGTFVTGEARSRAAVMRAEAAMVGDHSTLDVFVARIAVEPFCAEVAASARTTSDEQALRRLLDEQRGISSGDEPADPDRLHRAIAEATHNSVLVALVGQLVAMTHQVTCHELRDRAHAQIVASVLAGDGTRAREAMTAHLRAIEEGCG
ncbi:MAG: GntR family transcriptional regulator [Streptosporangiales bacterium]|nr:GntR family transcriptional regulator [Streptosporangiales bacterium]